MFWDTFVFNEKGNKLLHKVIAKYVQMGKNFHFYDTQLESMMVGKQVKVKVCVVFNICG